MLIALLACGGGGPPPVVRPPGVPEAAAFLRYSGNELMLDDASLGPWVALASDPDAPFEPLLDGLDARLVKEAGTWIALPGNASWGEARRAIHAVFESDADPIWLGALGSGEAFGPLDNAPSSAPILSCPAGPLPIVGVQSRLALELHADDDQTWALAHVRFLPRVEVDGQARAADYLPPECWKPSSCEVLGDPSRIEACRASAASGSLAPERVEVGGEVGCVLPLGKGSGGHRAWREELPKVLGRLGLPADTGAMVLADENVLLDPLLSVLSGLKTHGIAKPQLGMMRMGSADGAPTCTAEVKDAAALGLAEARWLGARLAPLGTP